jgi:hypothetical protein
VTDAADGHDGGARRVVRLLTDAVIATSGIGVLVFDDGAHAVVPGALILH